MRPVKLVIPSPQTFHTGHALAADESDRRNGHELRQQSLLRTLRDGCASVSSLAGTDQGLEWAGGLPV